MASLQARSADYRNQMRRQLLQRVGLGNENPYSTYRPNVMDPLGASTPAYQRGGLSLRYGIMPTEADVDSYVTANGGNPYTKKLISQANRVNSGQRIAPPGPAAPAAPVAPAEPDLFTQAYEAALADSQRAREENLKRYDEVKGMYGDLAQRNMGRIDNWGRVQEQLNQDRATQALGNQRAMLASRGLQNSTIAPAFEARNQRDLALVQQDLSERRDDRAVRYDSADTERLGGFIERRNDTGPDMGALMQLALEYGKSGNGEGLKAVQDEIDGLRRQMATRGQRGGSGYQPFYNVPRYGQQGAPPVFLGANALTGGFGGGQRPVPQVEYYGDEEDSGQRGMTMATLARLQREHEAKQARLAKRREAQAAALTQRAAQAFPVQTGQAFPAQWGLPSDFSIQQAPTPTPQIISPPSTRPAVLTQPRSGSPMRPRIR